MTNFSRIIPVFFLALVTIFGSTRCTSDNNASSNSNNTPKVPEKKNLTIPKFDMDSAFQYVEKQVSFGPRVPSSDAHQQCKEWLVEKLESFGTTVIEQDFEATLYTGEKHDFTNIIGQYNPAAAKRIILAAHWDSRLWADSKLSAERRDQAIDGADDGASGVGVLLEIARQLQANPIENMGVDFILFDAEDNGEHSEEMRSQLEEMESMKTWCLGSQYWSRNPHKNGYRAQYGILLDMVGAKNARFPKEGFSMQIAPSLVNKIWKMAQGMGYSNYFTNEEGGAVTDDHYFVASIAKIPMIDIIHLSADEEHTFGEHWHTHNDNIDVIDPRTLRAVGQVVTAVIYKEAGNVL
jgi:glutaminyl-peptide cyclotransferase